MITNYTKQTELIKVEEFNTPINVVGCGALGSWIVFFLLKMGFSNINVWDFDNIEEHNLPNQCFREADIGKSKVTAMMEIYKTFINDEEMKSRLNVHTEKITVENANMLRGVVLCCVDSMRSRKEIYRNCMKFGQATLWVEGRLSIFGAYIYTLTRGDRNVYDQYERTLYEDTEAEVSACGVSQTALPSAVNCATMMIMQMIMWHNEKPLQHQIMYQIPDLINMNMMWDRKEEVA